MAAGVAAEHRLAKGPEFFCIEMKEEAIKCDERMKDKQMEP
jgi:hypothetical protein